MSRMILILASGAIAFGLAGGYAWAEMTAKPPRPTKAMKAAFAPLPASPEERPAPLDREWESRSTDKAVTCAKPAPDQDGGNAVACAPTPAT
jgi:hypothetical protein